VIVLDARGKIVARHEGGGDELVWERLAPAR